MLFHRLDSLRETLGLIEVGREHRMGSGGDLRRELLEDMGAQVGETILAVRKLVLIEHRRSFEALVTKERVENVLHQFLLLHFGSSSLEIGELGLYFSE